LLEEFDNTLRIGFSAFRTRDGVCPDMTGAVIPTSGASLDVAERLPLDATAGDDTPLGEAIASVRSFLDTLQGPRTIVVVTNADPDSCAVLDPQCGYDKAIKAVQDARLSDIGTIVIGLEGGGLSPWFGQALANAGAGAGVVRASNIDDCEQYEGASTAFYLPPESVGVATYYALGDDNLAANLTQTLRTVLSGLEN
jgi:hypothetical protein